MDAGLGRELRLTAPLHLGRTLGPLRQGRRDPALVLDGDTAWRATRTPAGPATTCVRVDAGRGTVAARSWGPGRVWALDHVGDLVGADDDDGDLARMVDGRASRPDRVLRELMGRLPGLRIPRSRAVVEILVPVILAQKVTGLEAKRSYRELMAALGEPAPGPGADLGLVVPPPPEVLAETPSWTFHRFGVERKRADTIRAVGRAHRRLEEAADLTPDVARRRLMALPGIGPWTAAEVAVVAFGDPDAVSIGDYHLPNQVAWALAGEARADDRRMLELLEPYRGQRARVLRLLVAGGITAPRFGPRLTVTSFRHR